jgi:hypothetical protein
MGQHLQLRRDPFYVSGERTIDHHMLQVAMEGRETKVDKLRKLQIVGRWKTGNVCLELVGGTRDDNFHRAWIKDFRQRVGAAVVGGIFLLGPM